ncbi:MAG: glycosyltransferase family 2 protein, partial [Crocinitomicaceae bacterium]|nr:glycosyltransferase family 2 protein [Crocinitomicaceae bacterium]
MKVCGFTFIRNALKYDYPILEAIYSILPLCDEFVVAVGNSEDETLKLIQNIASEKIKIFETKWDDTQREGGKVLAIETDKAFKAISKDADWCFYIQGDEVIHEKYLPAIKQGMEKNQHQDHVDGLLFKYLHFYGSYDYIGDSSKWYSHEIRVVKNNPKIYSFKDAQGFRKNENEK